LFRKYGARKTWHLLGSVLVALSFPFIFLPCLGCRFVLPPKENLERRRGGAVLVFLF
jgi:hypothetical protein